MNQNSKGPLFLLFFRGFHKSPHPHSSLIFSLLFLLPSPPFLLEITGPFRSSSSSILFFPLRGLSLPLYPVSVPLLSFTFPSFPGGTTLLPQLFPGALFSPAHHQIPFFSDKIQSSPLFLYSSGFPCRSLTFYILSTLRTLASQFQRTQLDRSAVA